jgi:hypothetical protein
VTHSANGQKRKEDVVEGGGGGGLVAGIGDCSTVEVDASNLDHALISSPPGPPLSPSGTRHTYRTWVVMVIGSDHGHDMFKLGSRLSTRGGIHGSINQRVRRSILFRIG